MIHVTYIQNVYTVPKRYIQDQNSNIIQGKYWINLPRNHYHKLTLHPLFEILLCLVLYHMFISLHNQI